MVQTWACVCEAMWVFTEARQEGSFQPRRWETLWMLGGISYEGPMNFLWWSYEFPIEVLWSSYAGPTLSQAVMVSSPDLYINFHSFARAQCKPSANPGESAVDVLVIWDWSSIDWPSPNYELCRRTLCTGLFLLQSHSHSPRSLFRPKSPVVSRLCFCVAFSPMSNELSIAYANQHRRYI